MIAKRDVESVGSFPPVQEEGTQPQVASWRKELLPHLIESATSEASDPTSRMTELSYHLRTPLGTIIGYAELLEEELSELRLTPLQELASLLYKAGHELLGKVEHFEQATEHEMRIRRLSHALHDISDSASISSGAVYNQLLSRLAEVIPCRSAWWLRPEVDEWECVADWRNLSERAPEDWPTTAPKREANPLLEALVALGGSVHVAQVKQQAACFPLALWAPYVKCWSAIPLELAPGETSILLFAHHYASARPEAEKKLLLEAQGLVQRVLDHLVQFNKAQQLAEFDELTKAWNRRAFTGMATQQLQMAHRVGRHAAVLMIDIDFFKKVNDTYGHLVGDIVLAEVAARMQRSLRDGDILARFGGEEFVLLLLDAAPVNSMMVAERLRQAVAGSVIEADESSLQVTVSIGLCNLELEAEQAPDLEKLLHRADMALYHAKRTGRNRVCCAHDLEEDPGAVDV